MELHQYRLVVEQAPAGLFQLDPSGRLTFVNGQMEALCGCPGERLLGSDWIEVVHRDERKDVGAAWGEAKRAGAPFERRLRLLRPDGSEISVCGQIAPLRQVEGFIGSILPDKAAFGHPSLSPDGTATDAFLYLATHDLRAPLRAVDVSAATLSEKLAGRGGFGSDLELQRIRSAVARMDDLLERILQFSLAGRGPLEQSPVDLSAVARSVAAELQPSMPHIHVEVEQGLADTGDPVLLRVALFNLLNNAFKFSQFQPNPRVAFGRGADGAYFVRDNGVGIPVDRADRLFEPFQRLNGDDRFGGNGLGLTTVRMIVRRHGGEVWAEHPAGGGAEFRFTLADGPK